MRTSYTILFSSIFAINACGLFTHQQNRKTYTDSPTIYQDDSFCYQLEERPQKKYLSLSDSLWEEVERMQHTAQKEFRSAIPSDEELRYFSDYLSREPLFGGQSINKGNDSIALLKNIRDTTILPTRCENPLNYSILKSKINIISNVAKKEGKELNRPFLYATLSKPIVNALTVSDDNSDRWIALFNERLFWYFWGFGSLLVSTLEIRHAPDGDGWIAKSTPDITANRIREYQLGQSFARELLIAGEFAPRSSLPSKVSQPLSNGYKAFNERLVIPMELWVAAHEYLHAVMNHRFKSNAQKSWKQELDADTEAALLISVLEDRTDSPALLYLAPIIAIKALEFLELTCNVLHDGESPTVPRAEEKKLVSQILDTKGKSIYSTFSVGTHPPIWLRLSNLKELRFEQSKTQEWVGDSMVSLISNADSLFMAAIPEILKIRNKIGTPKCEQNSLRNYEF